MLAKERTAEAQHVVLTQITGAVQDLGHQDDLAH